MCVLMNGYCEDVVRMNVGGGVGEVGFVGDLFDDFVDFEGEVVGFGDGCDGGIVGDGV